MHRQTVGHFQLISPTGNTAPLWRELAWGVTYNNTNLATFSCLRRFFLPSQPPSLNKKHKSALIFVQKAVSRRSVITPSSGYTRLSYYNSWKIWFVQLPGPRVDFRRRSVGIYRSEKHTNTTFELFYMLKLRDTSFVANVFPFRCNETLPKTNEAERRSAPELQGEREREQIWAGEMWCAQGGWESLLRKKSWDVT